MSHKRKHYKLDFINTKHKRLLKDLKDKSQTRGKYFQNTYLTKDLNLEYIKNFQNKTIRK